MKIKATNRLTGELIELPANQPKEVMTVWLMAQELEKVAKALKDQAKKIVPELIGPTGTSEPIDDYQFRLSSIQRMNYDKTTLRDLIDPDFYDVLVKPDKPLIDSLLKKQDPVLWPISPTLRQTMIPEGQPYSVIKLEKL